MFKRNDYALLAARILLICNFLVGILLCPIISIWLAVIIHWSYIFIIFPLLASVCIFWIIGRLILSFFSDVKLIRNKLYENSNDGLQVFLKSRKDIINSKVKENSEEIINTELTDLRQSINNDITSNEEFENANANDAEDNDKKLEKNKVTKANIISVVVAIVLSLITILIILLTRIL